LVFPWAVAEIVPELEVRVTEPAEAIMPLAPPVDVLLDLIVPAFVPVMLAASARIPALVSVEPAVALMLAPLALLKVTLPATAFTPNALAPELVADKVPVFVKAAAVPAYSPLALPDTEFELTVPELTKVAVVVPRIAYATPEPLLVVADMVPTLVTSAYVPAA